MSKKAVNLSEKVVNLSDFAYIRVLPRGREIRGRASRDSPPRVGTPASIPTGRRNRRKAEPAKKTPGSGLRRSGARQTRPRPGARSSESPSPALLLPSPPPLPGKPLGKPSARRPSPREASIYRILKTGGPRKCGQMRAAGGNVATYSTRADGFAAPHRHGGESRNDRRLRHGRSRAARSATEGENMKITRRGRASSARRRWRA